MKVMKNVKNVEENVANEKNANAPNGLRTAKKKILKTNEEDGVERNQNHDPLEAIQIP